MEKYKVKEALDKIADMSDNDIAINHDYIRSVAQDALGLMGNFERRVTEFEKLKRKVKAEKKKSNVSKSKVPTRGQMCKLVSSILKDGDYTGISSRIQCSFNTNDSVVVQAHFEFDRHDKIWNEVRKALTTGIHAQYPSIGLTFNY